MNMAYRIIMEADQENREASGRSTPVSVKEKARRAEEFFLRAVACLDSSELTVQLEEDILYESAFMLKEILDRVELPSMDQIPDANDIETLEEEEIIKWKIHGTEITIQRIDSGPLEGGYLFSPYTLTRLDEFYKRIKHLPYKSNALTSPGFYDFYITTPGKLPPPKWSYMLPEWSNRLFGRQTIWKWFAFVLMDIVATVIAILAYFLFLHKKGRSSPAKRYWGRVLFCVIIVGMLTILRLVGYRYVNISGKLLIVMVRTYAMVAWSLMAFGAFSLGMAIAETIIASPKIDPEGLQASYLRASFGVIGFIGSIAIIVYGLSRAGVTLLPLLTGLGIGGIALGLAARPSLGNIIASFMIFADNPYRAGQRIKVMGHDGFVESIGLRSTRIKQLDGLITSIPNEKMAEADIENITLRPFIRRALNITITYDTPPEKIKRAVEILHEILSVPDEDSGDQAAEPADDSTEGKGSQAPPHPNEAINKPDYPPRVYFNDLNADSLNILVYYWYHPGELWDYLEHCHEVNIKIMERFNAEGISFAFPTQTLHLEGGLKTNTQRRKP